MFNHILFVFCTKTDWSKRYAEAPEIFDYTKI